MKKQHSPKTLCVVLYCLLVCVSVRVINVILVFDTILLIFNMHSKN